VSPLTAADSCGLSTSDSMAVHGNNVNKPPAVGADPSYLQVRLIRLPAGPTSQRWLFFAQPPGAGRQLLTSCLTQARRYRDEDAGGATADVLVPYDISDSADCQQTTGRLESFLPLSACSQAQGQLR
jgi:hypothetical protein